MKIDSLHFYMQEALAAGKKGLLSHLGGPFGAVIVKDNRIISSGSNEVTSTNDPTAHAEIVAIRRACQSLKTFSLEGAFLFTTCEPCPMCLSALYWARIQGYYYAATQHDAQKAGFDDSFFYEELRKSQKDRAVQSHQMLREEALELFSIWNALQNKIPY